MHCSVIRRSPNAQSSASRTRNAARSSRPSWCRRPDAEPGDALAKALQDFVKQAIAPYKYPRSIAFVMSLPRTQTGKLQRYKLRLGKW